MTDDTSISSQFRAFALLATLRTANEVRQTMAERRAGRDPSAQEAGTTVRDYLAMGLPEWKGLVTRLRVSLVVERDERAALVHAFEDRLVLARLARELHIVHQRLLSLYPDVPEALVEETRLRQQEGERLASGLGEHFEALLTAWLDRVTDLFEGIGKVVEEAN